MQKTKQIGWGLRSPLVKLISKRTKISPADVSDVLKSLNKAIVDILIELNPKDGECVNFPLIATKYLSKSYMGKPTLTIKKTPTFRREVKRFTDIASKPPPEIKNPLK